MEWRGLRKQRKDVFYAFASALSLTLILAFSTKPPWVEAPKISQSAFFLHPAPEFHVRPDDKILGWVDTASATKMDGANGRHYLQAKGWAASCIPAVHLVAIYVLSDGNIIGKVAEFTPRSDVAAAYGRSDFTSSGWEIKMPIEDPLGRPPRITFLATLENGISWEIPGAALTFH